MSLKSIEKLRDYANVSWEPWAQAREHLHRMLDAIEAEAAGLEATAENLAADLADVERTHTRLPVDADGEPIRLGDKMEGVDKYDMLREVAGEVIEIAFNATDGGHVESVALQVWAEDRKSWHKAYVDKFASIYRHVRPRTVEDVLEDFLAAYDEWDEHVPIDGPHETRSELFARFADEIRGMEVER